MGAMIQGTDETAAGRYATQSRPRVREIGHQDPKSAGEQTMDYNVSNGQIVGQAELYIAAEMELICYSRWYEWSEILHPTSF